MQIENKRVYLHKYKTMLQSGSRSRRVSSAEQLKTIVSIRVGPNSAHLYYTLWRFYNVGGWFLMTFLPKIHLDTPCEKCAHCVCEVERNTPFYSMFWINWQDQNQSIKFILSVTHQDWCNLYNLLHRIWVYNIEVFGMVQWELNKAELCNRWLKSGRNLPVSRGPYGSGLGD